MNSVSTKVPPLWQLLFGIIDRPTATFKAVLARRKWWMWAVPLFLVFLCFAVLMVVRAPYDLEITLQQMERQLASMPPEQADAARASMETFTSLPFRLATGLTTGIILVLIGIVGQAALLYFGALVAGGEVDFGSVFTMSAWTRLPTSIYFLAQAGFILLAKRTIEAPGLSVLVATGDVLKDAQNPLYMLLARIDPFWLWHLLLVVLGLSVVARFSRFKSLVLTLVYAALSLVITVVPSLLVGGLAGG
jgi:uncharacterized membrane protein YhaH (DUF805 family)